MTHHTEYQQREKPASTPPAYGATDVGCVRDHNEDALRIDTEAGLYIVADGMGGHAAGEVASAIVVEAVPEYVRGGQGLSQALCETHRAIRRAAAEGRGAPGMGSTAVVLRLSGADYEIAWVGDSRAYLWDGRALRQLSRDHSFVQKMLDAQAITTEEAGQHPDRNVITQSLGMAEFDQVQPDTATGRLYRGEKILLCSDGLSSEVADEGIAQALAANGAMQSQAQALVGQARRAGGNDNITVLLVQAPDDAPDRPATTQPFDALRLKQVLQTRAPRRWWIPAVALAAGIAGAAAVGWAVLRDAATTAAPGAGTRKAGAPIAKQPETPAPSGASTASAPLADSAQPLAASGVATLEPAQTNPPQPRQARAGVGAGKPPQGEASNLVANTAANAGAQPAALPSAPASTSNRATGTPPGEASNPAAEAPKKLEAPPTKPPALDAPPAHAASAAPPSGQVPAQEPDKSKRQRKQTTSKPSNGVETIPALKKPEELRGDAAAGDGKKTK